MQHLPIGASAGVSDFLELGPLALLGVLYARRARTLAAGGHPVPGALVFSMAEGLVIPTTLQGSGLAFLSMGFDIKGPTYVNDTIHVEIAVTEIKPTSKNPMRALVRTTNEVKNQKGETVLVYTPLRMMQGR